MAKETYIEALFLHIKAGYQILSVNSPEENSVLEETRQAGWKMGQGVRCRLDQEMVKSWKLITKVEGEQFSQELNNLEMTVDIPKMLALVDHLNNKYEEAAEHGQAALERGEASEARYLAEQAESFMKSRSFVTRLLHLASYETITWDTVAGFSDQQVEGDRDIGLALTRLTDEDRFPRNCIFLFRDIHPYLNCVEAAMLRRQFRTLFEEQLLINRRIRRPLVLVQPAWAPHVDIQHCVTHLNFDLPDAAQLAQEIEEVQSSITNPAKRVLADDTRVALRHALRGFTRTEANNALSYCVAKYAGFVPEMVPTVHQLKAELFKNDDVLEYVDAATVAKFSDIGAYDNYFEFIQECVEVDSDEAAAAGLKQPKGALILGPPGTGKSLVAMATAGVFQRPLVKYNFGAVFGSLIGESESRQRQAIRRITALGRIVLLVDEADKAFAGVVGASGDSGVSQRVFGQLLSWMANDNHEAFVIMTMNRLADSSGVQIVPVETIRAGRLDATFYTDLPDPLERQAILKIHMRKNRIDPEAFSSAQWKQIAAATDSYVGSELEQICVKAARMAWKRTKTTQPDCATFLDAKKSVTPVTSLDKPNIDRIRDFCKTRATPVSRSEETTVKAGGVRGGRSIDTGGSNN